MYLGRRIGLVIPAYNEQRLITRVLDDIHRCVDLAVVVNDGSKDRTRELVEGWLRSNPDSNVVLINHEENRGHGAAILTGYRYCMNHSAEWIVTVDGDAQMDQREIPRLLAPMAREGTGGMYVKGNRFLHISATGNNPMPVMRRFGNFMLEHLTAISTGIDISDSQNGFTVVSSSGLLNIDRHVGLHKLFPRYGFFNEMLLAALMSGVKVVEVSNRPIYGDEQSHINLGSFIPSVSWLLMKGTIVRAFRQYVVGDIPRGKRAHPIGVGFFAWLLALLAWPFLLPMGLGFNLAWLGGAALGYLVLRNADRKVQRTQLVRAHEIGVLSSGSSEVSTLPSGEPLERREETTP